MEHDMLIELLSGPGIIEDENAREIARRFTRHTYEKGDFMLRAGQVNDVYLSLETGAMRAFACDTDGNEVTTNFFTPGRVVFEVSSFFNRTPSNENIHALTRCTGWALTFEDLNDLFHALPSFRDFGRHTLVKNFSLLKARTLSMISQTAEQRYASLLEQWPEIFQYAQLKHVATYLGVTDTSLSRIRREFAKR